MKKTFIFLLLLMTMLVEAVAQNDAMFVYRNDGVINAFLKTDIDSIKHSNLDVDSILHKEYVIQEVWTVDSVYRIPLAVIDSVSFVTPPTIYKEGVTKMEEELVQYVIGADSLSLKLKSETPPSLIPQPDDLLVLLEGCNVLPNGFAGKVTSINTQSNCIEVICEQTYIEDVFDSFCSVQTLEGYADDNEEASPQNSPLKSNRAIYNPDDKVFSLGPFTFSENDELSQGITPDGDLALKGGVNYSVTVKPTFRIHTFLIVGEGQGTYFNCSITGNLGVTTQSSIYGGLEWKHEFLNPVLNFPIANTGGLINFYLNLGLFIRADMVMTSTLSDYRNYTFGMAFDYSSKGEGIITPCLRGRLASSSTDLEGSIDGSAAFGVYSEMGFNVLSREISRVCVRGEKGVQLSGNFVLRNSDLVNAKCDTALYAKLKASSVEWGPFANMSLVSSILKTEVCRTWQLSGTMTKWNLVPTFNNTIINRIPPLLSEANAYTELSGNCFRPVRVGYKIFDSNMNRVDNYEAPESYTNQACQLENSFYYDNWYKGQEYTLYPTVKIFGYEMLASPCAKLTNPYLDIFNLEVRRSGQSFYKFINTIPSYYYWYDVAVNGTIEPLEGVADWGYIIYDSFRRPISLMGHDQSNTATDYVEQDGPHSTIRLLPYVRFEGDPEDYYGEMREFPLDYEGKEYFSCPDGNHPHAIDLGLPSGVKWACCNIGATAPNQNGGYYAWGETKEKESYYWDNYLYYVKRYEDDEWIDSSTDIGADIAGTPYDVAHVQWGGSWVMPSEDRIKELMDNCEMGWCRGPFLFGILVTGPSGGQIYLPAASYREGNMLENIVRCNYWSSNDLRYWTDDHTRYLTSGSAVQLFSHGFYDWRLSSANRFHGQSVRAVCR